jgi:hypothetical protein
MENEDEPTGDDDEVESIPSGPDPEGQAKIDKARAMAVRSHAGTVRVQVARRVHKPPFLDLGVVTGENADGSLLVADMHYIRKENAVLTSTCILQFHNTAEHGVYIVVTDEKGENAEIYEYCTLDSSDGDNGTGEYVEVCSKRGWQYARF